MPSVSCLQTCAGATPLSTAVEPPGPSLMVPCRVVVRSSGCDCRERIPPHPVLKCVPWREQPSPWVSSAPICYTGSQEVGLRETYCLQARSEVT